MPGEDEVEEDSLQDCLPALPNACPDPCVVPLRVHECHQEHGFGCQIDWARGLASLPHLLAP